MIRVLSFSIFFCLVSVLCGQEKDKAISVIKSLEADYNVIFNYDEMAMGLLDLPIVSEGSLNQKLDVLFRNTAYEWRQEDDNILLVEQIPKEYKVCGYLKSNLSDLSLPYANVFLSELNVGAQTNEQGYFEFTVIGQKHNEITLSYIAYEDKQIMLQDFTSNCPVYHLTEDLELLGNEIVIREYILKGIEEGSNYSSISMSFDRLNQDYLPSQQDLLKTTQLLPGISSYDDSATRISIRGSNPDQNMVVWEGGSLYDPGHFFGMISSINPFTISKVDIYKGVYDPKHQNRVGGIVEIGLSDQVDAFKSSFGTTMTEAHGAIEAPLIKKKLELIVSGRTAVSSFFESPTLFSYADQLFQGIDNEESNEEVERELEINEDIKYHDINAKLIFRPIDKLRITSSVFHSRNSFSYSLDNEDEEFELNDQFEFDNVLINNSAEFKLNSKSQIGFAYNYSRYQHESLTLFNEVMEDEEDAIESSIFVSNGIEDHSYKVYGETKLSKYLDLSLGYTYNVKDLNYKLEEFFQYEEDIEDEQQQRGELHNVYASSNLILDNWLVDLGLRATHYKQHDAVYWSPRFNVQYRLNEQVKMKASSGIFHQFIAQVNDPEQNNLNVDSKIWSLIFNEEKDVLSAQKLAFGAIYKHNGWLLDAEVYQNQTFNMSTFTNVGNSDLDIEEIGESTAKGLDILVNKSFSNYNAWVNYSISKVDFNFEEMDTSFPSNLDQRHRLSIINQMNLGDWSFALTYVYKSGLPYTAVTGIDEYFENDDELVGELEFDDLNSERFEDYKRLDVGVGYSNQLINNKLNIQINFNLTNVLDYSNRYSRQYFITNTDDFDEDLDFRVLDKYIVGRTPQLLVRLFW